MARKKSHKNILILGAGSGMAMAFIQLLSKSWQHCTFHLLARDIQQLDAAKQQAEALGHQVILYTYDLLNPPKTDFTGMEFCVVYAGWLPPDNTEPEKTMTINCTGIQQFLDKFIPLNRLTLEHVIVTGSIAGTRVRPSNKAYGQAKANLHSYVYDLQKKWASIITITLTIPGYVKTKMIAGHIAPAFLTVTPEKMAEKYLGYFETKPTIVYSQPAWRLIAFVLKMIPEFIMKRLKF